MAADDYRLVADPLVVRAWVSGWTQARETPPPVPDAGGLRVDVGWPEQRTRYVFPHCCDGLRHLADAIVDPWIFLKVCASREEMRVLLPSRWVIQPLGFMMSHTESEVKDVQVVPEEYSFDVTDAGSVPVAKILTVDNDVAAIGRVTFVDEFAIYDRIVTHENHRRRGLGSAVMRILQNIAVSRGKSRGVLVATAAGRALYETLGWQMHSLYTTAVIPGPASNEIRLERPSSIPQT
jgi:GNAT superfamily N-acetyltransferase